MISGWGLLDWVGLLTLASLVALGALLLWSLYCYVRNSRKKPSYLPRQEEPRTTKPLEGSTAIRFVNAFFALEAAQDGRVTISTPAGESIITLACIYQSWTPLTAEARKYRTVIPSGRDIMRYRTADALTSMGLASAKVRGSTEGTATVLEISGETPVAKVTTKWRLKEGSPSIEITTETNYNEDVALHREALRLCFDVRATRLISPEGRLERPDSTGERWLSQGGALFGEGGRSAAVNHVPDVSSLQVRLDPCELWVNLDYAQDHPHIHFPQQDTGMGFIEDRSDSTYLKGERRSNAFTIHIGRTPRPLLRSSPSPHGCLATFVWTEHADGGDIRTHRAVYLGQDDLRHVRDATGGFVKHSIPVTKSVFYANPLETWNGLRSNVFSTREIAIKGNSDFLDLLDQLHETGDYEIVLHTPQPGTAERAMIDEAVRFMRERFAMETWIDHGMTTNNREAFVNDGLDPTSPQHAADVWRENSIRFFWNAAREELGSREREEESIGSQLARRDWTAISTKVWQRLLGDRRTTGLNALRSMEGSGAPSPIWWQHPNISPEFYSWATASSLWAASSGKVWSGTHGPAELQQLIDERGVAISHAYPAYVHDRNRGYWLIQGERVVVDPDFDDLLARLAAFREKGELHLGTIGELMQHWIALGQIRFDHVEDGVTRIVNDGPLPISGATFAADVPDIFINGDSPPSKKVDGDIVFWIDLEANTYTTAATTVEASLGSGNILPGGR